MRIRRWEEEEEYDWYMRDRDGEERTAVRADRLGRLSAHLAATARRVWEHATACGTLFYAPGLAHRELHAS